MNDMDVERRCDNCENGEYRDNGYFCDAPLEALRRSGFSGMPFIKMAPEGSCDSFEPSDSAIDEAREAAAEWAYMQSRAGIDYPASLGR